MFASPTLLAHLARGIAAALCLYLAVMFADRSIIAAVLFSGAAILLLRGCPMCWAVGLIETLGASRAPCSSCAPTAASASGDRR